MKRYLSWIWLLCGLGLLLMGLTSSWNDAAFTRPEPKHLQVLSGQLQKVTFSAPAKSPTLVELVVYHKKTGLMHGYLRYGLHAWEERLKPFVHQDITMLVGAGRQVWGVEDGQMSELRPILRSAEIEKRLQGMKQAQQNMADKIMYAGLVMVLLWLVWFQWQRQAVRRVYS